MLAHAATAQGRVALGIVGKMSDVMPAAVFTHPECGMVGLTEAQCTDRGIDCNVGTAIYRSNGKALAMDEPDGMVKIMTEKESGKILGCHICGAHAADLVQEVSVAMQCGMTADALRETIHIHPTLSELIVSALEKI